jgi:hypothetical protein
MENIEKKTKAMEVWILYKQWTWTSVLYNRTDWFD